MKKIKQLLIVGSVVMGLLFSNSYVLAQDPTVISLENPIGVGTDINTIIGNIIKVSLGLVGAFALLVFVYGGFLWLTSGGNKEKVKTGSKAMLYAFIGIFLIFSSYAILNVVLGEILS